MKLFKNPYKLSIIYSVSSVFLGPLIFLLGLGLTRGGGDYCDSVYRLPNGDWDPGRTTEFQNAQLFQVIGAGILLLIGASLLFYLIMDIRKNKTNANYWVVLSTLFMMAGYVVVIMMSGKGGQIC